MKVGDLVRYRSDIWAQSPRKIYIVRYTEPKNNWVFIYGVEVPVSMSIMEVISESR